MIDKANLNAGGFRIPSDPHAENPWTERQYQNAREWLETAYRTKHPVKRGMDSYGWKHIASSALQRKHDDGGDYYISNGAFIAAAIDLGFIVDQCKPGYRNAWLNLSKNNRPVRQPAWPSMRKYG